MTGPQRLSLRLLTSLSTLSSFVLLTDICLFLIVSSFVRINSWRAPNKSTEEDSDGQSGLLRVSLFSFSSIFDIRCCVSASASLTRFGAAAVDSVVASVVANNGFSGRTVCVAISLTRFGGSMGSACRTFVVILTGRKSIRFRSMELKSGAETRVLPLFVGFLAA